MAEEQPPALTEEQQEEVTSPPSSDAAGDNQTSAKEDGIQESHTTPEKILEGKTEKDTVQDEGLDGEHQRDGQTEAKEEGEEVTEEGDGGGDTVTSGGDATEGEKASTGANEEGSSTQEERADDFSGQKEEKSEASASSPEEAAATDVEGKSEEEQAQPSAKDPADKVDKSKSAASSVKDGAAAAPGKEAAGVKEQDRKSDIPRSKTMPKSYGRATKKDIAEKFGGVATSGIRVQRSTSCGANAVKNMLLEWCRAKTRGREGVEIQNFSSSWSSGLAFCALIVAFFPDAFDYDSLDPKNRRQNFQLAFNAAEKFADCPPLLDVEDMVRMKVPDSKCVYTYVQELYRSLVAKGLVKTKKA